MRRLARWALNTLTVLSLLLCVATAGLWVRSYVVADDYGRAGPTTYVGVGASKGEFEFAIDRRFPGPNGWPTGFPADAQGWSHETGPPSDQPVKTWAGFTTYRVIGYGQIIDRVLMPLWALTTLLGTVPVIRLWRVFRRRQELRTRGHCPICSYDLTGNVSGVCPECGTAIAKGNA